MWIYNTEDWQKTMIGNTRMALKLFPDAKFIRFHAPPLQRSDALPSADHVQSEEEQAQGQ